VVIADKQRIEPRPVCRRGSLDLPARSLARVLRIRVIARERDPSSHRVILVAGSGFDQTQARCPRQASIAVAVAKTPAPRFVAVAF
jgi:hypothetical protein